MSAQENLRYPVGRQPEERTLDPERRETLIAEIEALPERLREVLATLPPGALETPYRPEGWTVRQVVHHLADSHLNGYLRIRLALTEEVPTIKPYAEQLWAELPDVPVVSPDVSVALLKALHTRWVATLRGLPEEGFSREFLHPERQRRMTVDEVISSYAWHGRHHLAHIEIARGAAIVAQGA